MKIAGINAKSLIALAQKAQSSCPDGECAFAQMLQEAADAFKNGNKVKTADGSSDTSDSTSSSTNSSSSSATGDQVKMRLDQAIAEAFIAPLLAQTAINVEQKYFLHSPAEQAYAQQMYTRLAGQIGTSGKMPLAKGIAKAVLQQMGDSSLWTAETTQASES
jgi:hypothetical protein